LDKLDNFTLIVLTIIVLYLTWVCHSEKLSLEIYIQNCVGTLHYKNMEKSESLCNELAPAKVPE